MQLQYNINRWITVSSGVLLHLLLSQGGNAMKVNPKTVVFVLDLVAALAVAGAGVVVKHYIDIPRA